MCMTVIICGILSPYVVCSSYIFCISPPMVVVGILAVQGAFAEHEAMFKELGCAVQEVRTVKDLDKVDGLVIPGGESTTMKIIVSISDGDHTMMEALRAFVKTKPVWGTCAGLILLADHGVETSEKRCKYGDAITGMPITVHRNFFGRQSHSFEVALKDCPWPYFQAIFIRAPAIIDVAEGVTVLATINHPISEQPIMVAASWKKLFVTAFHPELTSDATVHKYFVENFLR
eukprot:GEMP01066955.1.p1 GENE.GEMP01066955.1~~GEMP01066955.1.p1  ORF type:complete len:231 (+),score=19.42 GEMP01066955.1:57-749(+)